MDLAIHGTGITFPGTMKSRRTDSSDPGPASRPHGVGTLCLHAGSLPDTLTGGVCNPIFPSTAHAFPNAENENRYPRYFNTPNARLVAEKVATLEQGEAALVVGSGMAAISTLLFSRLGPGDHAVFQTDLYGGTLLLVDELRRRGTEISFARAAEEFAAGCRPSTKLLYVETPSNPLLRITDLAAIAEVGRARGILTVADNTFATPINQNPLTLGMDVVVHSATKYLNGHSDVTAGVIVGSEELIARARECAINHGATLDSHACYLLERGLKTLALRIERHDENAQRLAEFLLGHPAVGAVHYPGLTNHPDHAMAKKQMRGFGGMLSCELRHPANVDSVLAAFRLVRPALSLGGIESLACLPCRTSHKNLSAEDRQRLGITDGLLRVSVGIEDFEDLRDDFEQALAGSRS